MEFKPNKLTSCKSINKISEFVSYIEEIKDSYLQQNNHNDFLFRG